MKRKNTLTLDDLVSEFSDLHLKPGEFTATQFKERTGLSENCARDYLGRLKKQGRLTSRPGYFKGRYVTAWRFVSTR